METTLIIYVRGHLSSTYGWETHFLDGNDCMAIRVSATRLEELTPFRQHHSRSRYLIVRKNRFSVVQEGVTSEDRGVMRCQKGRIRNPRRLDSMLGTPRDVQGHGVSGVLMTRDEKHASQMRNKTLVSSQIKNVQMMLEEGRWAKNLDALQDLQDRKWWAASPATLTPPRSRCLQVLFRESFLQKPIHKSKT